MRTVAAQGEAVAKEKFNAADTIDDRDDMKAGRGAEKLFQNVTPGVCVDALRSPSCT